CLHRSAEKPDQSVLPGRLAITWEVQDETLILAWVESGGPPVTKPKQKGFGTRSVIASIETQLGGRADFDWRAEGLICRLTVPLKALVGEAAAYRDLSAAARKPMVSSSAV
ncbi:MAG: two-component system response regulator protein-glutamate methylesterase, partial [Bradyrhizobium sp.]